MDSGDRLALFVTHLDGMTEEEAIEVVSLRADPGWSDAHQRIRARETQPAIRIYFLHHLSTRRAVSLLTKSHPGRI